MLSDEQYLPAYTSFHGGSNELNRLLKLMLHCPTLSASQSLRLLKCNLLFFANGPLRKPGNMKTIDVGADAATRVRAIHTDTHTK